MVFLSDSERRHLTDMIQAEVAAIRERMMHEDGDDNTVEVAMDPRCADSDHHLVFEGLHVLAKGNADRLYAMLHSNGHKSHPDANGGRTLLMMHKIADYGCMGAPHGSHQQQGMQETAFDANLVSV